MLLASCEAAITEWQTKNGKNKLKLTINKARHLAFELKQAGLPILQNHDPLKIILHTSFFGINGLIADDWFINNGVILYKLTI